MNEIIEYKQTITESDKNLNIAINKVINLVKLAGANIPGIIDFISNLDKHVELVCNSKNNFSYFKKIGISKKNNKFIGILLVGINQKIDNGLLFFKYSIYNVKLHYCFFSFDIDKDSSDIDQLKKEFETNFQSSIDNLHNIIFKNKKSKKLFFF